MSQALTLSASNRSLRARGMEPAKDLADLGAQIQTVEAVLGARLQTTRTSGGFKGLSGASLESQLNGIPTCRLHVASQMREHFGQVARTVYERSAMIRERQRDQPP